MSGTDLNHRGFPRNVPSFSEQQRALLQSPIKLPRNVYYEALEEFGKDEMMAGLVDAVSTGIANFVVPDEYRQYVLPVTGPVIEKIGFFIRHMYHAGQRYQQTPQSMREHWGGYFKQGVKDSMPNLLKDIFFHDPVYMGLMAAGIKHTPNVHPGVLSAISYAVGILCVGVIDVAKAEVQYRGLESRLKKSGFEAENYYESRFYVRADEYAPADLLDRFAKEFQLHDGGTWHYHDRYFPNSLKAFNGRTGRIRLRERTSDDGDRVATAQVVYTRASERKAGIDQVRYFPVEKKKLYRHLDGPMPAALEGIVDETTRKALLSLRAEGAPRDIAFERSYLHNDDLLICTDDLGMEKPVSIVEIKTHRNKKLLLQAMRYLMVECPLSVLQTTHSKDQLFTT